ncbi:MAG: PspC domain-containing protein [Bacteroidia bacterium]|nr:PspC domain-containing protein [Bacteroidia bacterium]
MDKTIKINLGGTLFQIDEEAYKKLRDYLQAIDRKFRNAPGGNETIEDIEFRIAEIFQSQKGMAGIISTDNVEAMISVIGKPEDFDQEGTEGTSYRHGSGPRKLFRNPDDCVIGGVCGGLGAYADTDPVWFRILFVVFALMAGIGFLVYLALWIALPSAKNSSQKREMYGSELNQLRSQDGELIPRYATTSKIGNATNQVFRAFGRVLFIIVRVLLIIFGTCLVLTGFLALLSFIMVFIFHYPGAFSTDIEGANLSYLPDFLNYIVSPGAALWIKALLTIAVSLPLLALIYGGVRLIFWFRASDGYIWLAALVLWVMTIAALAIILFNEGVGFAESEKTTSVKYFNTSSDTIYIMSGRKFSDLPAENEISVPDEPYKIMIDDDKKEVYIRTYLNISPDENNLTNIKITKLSIGRNRQDAIRNSERLLYDFEVSGDTLRLDEFCTIPSGSRWSFDELFVTVFAPAGTVIYMDRTIESLFHSYDDDDFVADPKQRFWRMTDDGLNYIEP